MISGSMYEAEALSSIKRIDESGLRTTDPMDLLDNKTRERVQQINDNLVSLRTKVNGIGKEEVGDDPADLRAKISKLEKEKMHILASAKANRRKL